MKDLIPLDAQVRWDWILEFLSQYRTPLAHRDPTFVKSYAERFGIVLPYTGDRWPEVRMLNTDLDEMAKRGMLKRVDWETSKWDRTAHLIGKRIAAYEIITLGFIRLNAIRLGADDVPQKLKKSGILSSY